MGGDIRALLDSDVGQPMARIFYQSFGQKGTLAIWGVIVIAQLVIIGTTIHNITNGFTQQVHDGVKRGEASSIMVDSSPASSLQCGSRFSLHPARHSPFFGTALCPSRLFYTG